MGFWLSDALINQWGCLVLMTWKKLRVSSSCTWSNCRALGGCLRVKVYSETSLPPQRKSVWNALMYMCVCIWEGGPGAMRLGSSSSWAGLECVGESCCCRYRCAGVLCRGGRREMFALLHNIGEFNVHSYMKGALIGSWLQCMHHSICITPCYHWHLQLLQ